MGEDVINQGMTESNNNYTIDLIKYYNSKIENYEVEG